MKGMRDKGTDGDEEGREEREGEEKEKDKKRKSGRGMEWTVSRGEGRCRVGMGG